MLQASVAYAEGDLATTRTLLDQFPLGDRHAKINRACVLFKEGKFEEARKWFEEAHLASGWSPDLAYNIAVCHFSEKSYGPALRCISELIERAVQEHPELSVGSGSAASGEVRSVGNTPALRETYLIEAFNLKVAIELVEGNFRGAQESLADMPPRREDELDPVSLHNSALVEVEVDATNPTGAFRKLNFLLSHPPFPQEAFGNLLLLYLRMDAVDNAADVLAENAHLVPRFLSPALGEFLDAYCMSGHSAEEAYERMDSLASRHTVSLRAHTKAIQDARLAHDSEGVKAGLAAFDDVLEAFMPVVLGMCKLFWEHDNFSGVEKELRKASEFAGEHEAWRIGMAHAVFMQGSGSTGGRAGGGTLGMDKYREAIRFYEPTVLPFLDEGVEATAILRVKAIVLANLCVAYIVTGDNSKAGLVLTAVTNAETVKLEMEAATEAAAAAGQGRGRHHHAALKHPPSFHSSIINLVIGTLYCAMGQLEFGVGRVLTALEPPSRKLGCDTWYYAKRALLHLGLQLAKGMLVITDSTFDNIFKMLDAAELYGGRLPAEILPPTSTLGSTDAEPPRTIATEARALKTLFLRLREQC